MEILRLESSWERSSQDFPYFQGPAQPTMPGHAHAWPLRPPASEWDCINTHRGEQKTQGVALPWTPWQSEPSDKMGDKMPPQDHP